jgi:hypothetical protein
MVDEGLARCRATGDRWVITVALVAAGSLALDEGNLERSGLLCQEGLVLAQDFGAPRLVAFHRGYLGRVAYLLGDMTGALALLGENLTVYQDHANKWGVGLTLHALGLVAWRQGDRRRAMTLLRESLVLRREMGNRPGIAECLEGLAAVATVDQGERAVRLLGAAEALRRVIAMPLPPVERPGHAATVMALRAALGEPTFAVAWEAGQAMTLEEVVAEALALDDSPAPAP